ncbi:uncharacterized protein METZ01_LOCUS206909, partial [marine metagenome]
LIGMLARAAGLNGMMILVCAFHLAWTGRSTKTSICMVRCTLSSTCTQVQNCNWERRWVLPTVS